MTDVRANKWRSVRMFEQARLEYAGKQERKDLATTVSRQLRAYARKTVRKRLKEDAAILMGKVVVKNGTGEAIEATEAGFGAELSTRSR